MPEPAATVTAVSASKGENPLIPNAALVKVFSLMQECRRATKKSSQGREAMAAAIGTLLANDDLLLCSKRDSVMRAARSADAEFGSITIADLAPATRTKLGIGAALSAPGAGTQRAVVVIAPARVLRMRTTVEALRLADKLKLPLILFTESLSKGDMSRVRVPFPVMTVDRADAVAVYRVLQEALDRARRKIGPTLVDCRVTETDAMAHMQEYLAARGIQP